MAIDADYSSSLTGAVETTLVDKEKTDTWDVAINRYANFNHMRNTELCEKGWLGNPFRPHEDGIHGDHLKRFREAGDTLACNCGRDRCHGEIIVEYLEDGINAIRPR